LSPCPVSAADQFAKRLAEAGEGLTGVIGEVASAEAFAGAWNECKPYSRRTGSRLGVYELERLRAPRAVDGALRQATPADMATLIPFAAGFYHDIGEPAPSGILERNVAEGRLFVWCDGEGRIVSMAAWAGPTPNGVRVNFVYTPAEFRRRGFASNCVAAVTHRLLKSGRKFVFLFTDVGNPISNHVYNSLGYARVGEHQPIHFDALPQR
jgi:predicted GNAT family acetyltransferase